MIPVYKPYLTKEILKYAHDAIDSTWISSIGTYKNKTIESLQDLTGAKNILLTNNGTSAVHLCAIALKYKYPHIQKIISSNNVYIAAINGFLYDKNSWKINITEPDMTTWNIKETEIKNDPNIAHLIVHNLGNIVNIPKLKQENPNTIFIEDNCEGFLGKYENLHSGTASFCSAMSFFGNKNITCGEGGAFYCNDDEVFEYITKIHGQGQTKTRYIHDTLGYNYRMTNIQAAILYGQLQYINEIEERKNHIFEQYRKKLSQIPNVHIQKYNSNETKHSNWFMGVRIENSTYESNLRFMTENGIEIRPMFYPLSYHKYLTNHIYIPIEDNAKILSKECFMLPSYPELTEEEIKYIIKNVEILSSSKYF